jgi:hypothetical protein
MTGLGCGKSKEDRIQRLKKQQQNDKQCSTKNRAIYGAPEEQRVPSPLVETVVQVFLKKY